MAMYGSQQLYSTYAIRDQDFRRTYADQRSAELPPGLAGFRPPPGLEAFGPQLFGSETPPPSGKYQFGSMTTSEGSCDGDTVDDSENSCTLLLRNIPCRLGEKDVCDLLDLHGFSGCYDFVYTPVDKRSKSNKGYAFISFVDVASLNRGLKDLQNLQFPNTKSKKVTEVAVATALPESQLAVLEKNRQLYKIKQAEEAGVNWQ
mmetsp:Transcript_58884/g.135857  ORF Transcript_58884/g.135857 Transcript_58884/m.135857 type:complete len:203 (-) Transcript_58884:240-848(-)|eukprot:CAMPEP_0204277594 /NCGR_PEP_ID=MMETSP0468-20130131/29397_1 /ASSEMBLY_ACC=CAM_ASM_000383 /TAXON_ID=2969 /ORGANISM="Oxyrrhis marina" /LENGTH=202 /DNA_ID=CAMNT_0051254403 /DNA_START=26 /DNA_END=634 /DNA_ORIENTATION=+